MQKLPEGGHFWPPVHWAVCGKEVAHDLARRLIARKSSGFRCKKR
jgi:hypothetical protein